MHAIKHLWDSSTGRSLEFQSGDILIYQLDRCIRCMHDSFFVDKMSNTMSELSSDAFTVHLGIFSKKRCIVLADTVV